MIGTCALMFIQSLIPACVFLFAGYLAGEGGIAWLIAAAVYAVIQFLMLNAETVRQILAKIAVTILCECALQYCSLRFGWFYHLFIHYHPHYGAPNAGTGFCVLLGYFGNAILFLLIAAYLVLKTSAEQRKQRRRDA